MVVKKLKSILSFAAELGASLGFVLVFFLLFLGILSLSFPRGTTLNDLLSMQKLQARAEQGDGANLQMEGLDQDPAEPLIAMLADLRRKVQNKPADGIAWLPAVRGMQLRERHAVQTFARSGATIAFDRDKELQLGQNSLLILRQVTQRQATGLIQAEAVVVEGEFHGRFGKDGPGIEMNIATNNGRFEVQSDSDRAADFKLSVDERQTSTLSVYEGRATAVIAGKSVVVEPDHFVTVDAHGRVSLPVRLPSAPESQFPAQAATYAFRSAPPEVRFGWASREQADGYRFELARDPKFEDTVHETLQQGTEFTHGHLAAGTYYWRVSAMRGGGQGRAGATRTVHVNRDLLPPGLRVEFPDEMPIDGNIVLRGSADADSRVFVRGVEVTADRSGEFEHAVSLEPGMNLLVVEAVDPVGNVAYQSRVLHVKNQ